MESIAQHLPAYAKGFVLGQGQEGAGAGFGLAAVINYLQWNNDNYTIKNLHVVSPRMLYQMAQLYYELADEDYEGSCCRGEMKG